MNKSLLRAATALILMGLLTGCQCSHEWREADCITPKTCSKCDLSEGETLPHQWQDATCSKAKNCILCGAEEGNILPHDYRFDAGYMRCSMCRTQEPGTGKIEPLSFPSENMSEEEMLAFIDLQGQNDVRNNARFRLQDDVLYGQYWDDAGQSLFISSNFSNGEIMLLDYGWAKNIYVVDGNIYYENIQPENQDHGIYRINMKDGRYVSQDKVSDSYGSMQLHDGYIYYSDFSDQFVSDEEKKPKPGLYRCDLDGSNVVRILDKPVHEFYVFDTGILYQDMEDGETLHLCYPNGSEDRKINDQVSSSPIYDGEYIYYLSTLNKSGKVTKNYTIWKTRPDGTENQQVSGYPIINMFALYEDQIYFGNGNTRSKLFRMKKDGTAGAMVMNDTYVYLIQFLNGRLKYTKYTSDLTVIEGNYFCDPDGKNSIKFDPFA